MDQFWEKQFKYVISNLTDLSNFKFYSFEVVDRVSETQVQVIENLNVAIKVLTRLWRAPEISVI